MNHSRRNSKRRWQDPRIDLSPFEKEFNMPKIPVWCEDLGPDTLGSFHPDGCDCGRPYGIALNTPLLETTDRDPNKTLIHEAVHALCHYFYPEAMEADKRQTVLLDSLVGDEYGYRNSKAEHIANVGSDILQRSGMKLWRDR